MKSAAVSEDLYFEITKWIRRSDVLHLALTCSLVYGKVIGAIYDRVELQQAEQCCTTLDMLSKHPEIARHVRKLVIRPDATTSMFLPSKYSPVDAHLVAFALKRAVPFLDAMHTFVWAGEEYPPEDDIWSALKTHCPQLKSIGVSFGSVLPSTRSNLFEFDNLYGFSINFESGFYRHMLFEISPETEPIYQRLWDFLINRCPDLRELAITTNGISPTDPVDAHRLCRGRWHNLRRLQLGNVIVNWEANSTGDRTPFITFLKEHESLEGLHFSAQMGISPEDLAELEPHSLPKLSEFSGTVDHLQALSHATSLTSIHISQPFVIRELTSVTLSNLLQPRSSVSSFKASFIVQAGYDSIGVLRSIANSCPQLRHLDLTCSHRPSFSLEMFARNIRSLSNLRSFNLTLVKSPSDESMCDGASRIAKSNPRLHEFSITYIQHNGFTDTRVAEKGEFELACDGHGLPLSLLARQRRSRRWGTHTTWNHRCELRPPGHPAVGKMGLVDMMLDKGQAGKEFRRIIFSLLLVFISVFAVIV